MVFQSLTERWPRKERKKEMKERRKKKMETLWLMLILCDTNYAMKERPDIKWPGNTLKILHWTFIWYKLGLNTLSCYGDRAAENVPKINLNC